MLIVKNWNKIHTIADPNPLNTGKNSILCLPNFHVETFPFLVSSGTHSFNLINVKEGSTEELIKASSISKIPAIC